MDLTGRCYCGAVTLSIEKRPETVAICHCTDCRRVTGAAVAAFAAFARGTVAISPDPGNGFEVTPGVRRWFCRTCGSPLAATFDYLPQQIYVPVGVLDFADELTPELQCHSANKPPWFETLHQLPKHEKSARFYLKSAKAQP